MEAYSEMLGLAKDTGCALRALRLRVAFSTRLYFTSVTGEIEKC